MPCLPVRFSDQDLVPIRAYARASHLPVSSAVRTLVQLGLRASSPRQSEAYLLRDRVKQQGEELEKLVTRIDDLINLSVQLLTITRLFAQASDKVLLDQALQSAKQAITDLNTRRTTPAAAALLHDTRSSP